MERLHGQSARLNHPSAMHHNIPRIVHQASFSFKRGSAGWLLDLGETIAFSRLLGMRELSSWGSSKTTPTSFLASLSKPLFLKKKKLESWCISTPPTGLFQYVTSNIALTTDWVIILACIWPKRHKPEEDGIKIALFRAIWFLCLCPVRCELCFVFLHLSVWFAARQRNLSRRIRGCRFFKVLFLPPSSSSRLCCNLTQLSDGGPQIFTDFSCASFSYDAEKTCNLDGYLNVSDMGWWAVLH